MGRFINIGNRRFQDAVNSEYVDKTELIAQINQTLDTEARMSCVTRCRRFGKSMAAVMLRAYYDKSSDSRALFQGLAIENDPTFERHLNRYPVIYVELTNLISQYGPDADPVENLKTDLIKDITDAYPDVKTEPNDDLMEVLRKISKQTGERFIMIIDEWDAICREFQADEKIVNRYVDFLRRLFKDAATEEVFVGAYITGIFPIKKYNTQSALNNFWEYTMMNPEPFAKYFGFTKAETEALCQKYRMDLDEMEKWYDGYRIGAQMSMFNPNSVMQAVRRRSCANYWSASGAFDNVTDYIQMNFDGLKDAIIDMLAGGKCPVNYTKFSNDLGQINSRDNVLTVLIHLGYLAYDPATKSCYIPNGEVREEMENAVAESQWRHVIDAIQASKALLKAALREDAEAVAAGVEKVHQRETSILSYHDENSLSCVLALAFYAARDEYIVHREFASGKGFADIAFIPRKNVPLPAMVIELKYNKDANTAIDQILRKDYPDLLRDHAENLLLIGINYDPKTKKHTCEIKHG